MSDGVNIPLLRKAVEWAEAEAAKPEELCEWRQQYWITPSKASERAAWGIWADSRSTTELEKSTECGTCYCIAGYVVATQLGPTQTASMGMVAAELLGIEYDTLGDNLPGNRLFRATNTIDDVRRIAEEIAGERL